MGKRSNPEADNNNVVRRQCIIVAGMHRSGTSALTRLFNLVGGTLPQNIMPANAFNVTGHFESTTISFLNEDILVKLGLSWSDIGNIDWESVDQETYSGFQKRISNAVAKEFPGCDLLLIKDPRICRLLPLWKDVIDKAGIEPSFAVPVRHPLEVAKSLEARDGYPLELGCLLWLRYVLEAERNTRDLPRAFAEYSELLSLPTETIIQMASTMRTELPLLIEKAETAITAFIDPTLRHHNASGVELKWIASLPSWLDRAWSAFTKLMSDPHDLTAQEQLDHVHDEFREASDAFAPLLRFERRQVEPQFEMLKVQMNGIQQRSEDEAARHLATTRQLTEQTARADAIEIQLAQQIARSAEAETRLADQIARHAGTEQLLAEQSARAITAELLLAEQTAHTVSSEMQLVEQATRMTAIEAQLTDHIAHTEMIERQLRDQTLRATSARNELRDQIELTTSISEHLANQLQRTLTLEKDSRTEAIRIAALERALTDRCIYIDAMLASTSWKITAPLRWFKRVVVS